MLGCDRRRAGSDGRSNKAQTVGLAACNGDEYVAAFYGAAICRHSANFNFGVARLELSVSGRNFAKLHVELLAQLIGVDDAIIALPAFLE
jgi:GMP synthase-like glutamine amidotransferase